MSFTLREILGQAITKPAQPEPEAPRIDCATGKQFYPSKAAARAVAKDVQHLHRTPLTVLRCGFCAGYHLGHQRGSIY